MSASAFPPAASLSCSKPHAEPGVGPVSDEHLASLAQGGSHRAFAELVDRFQHRIYSFLRRRLPTPQDAEDVAQATFVRAWRSLRTYDPGRPFGTWLFTIAARASSGHLRTIRRNATLIDGAAPVAPDALETSEQAKLAWTIAHRLLSTEQYTALWLRYAESMPMREIAEVLGRSEVSVRVGLHRARELIAEEMERLGNMPPRARQQSSDT